MRRAGPACDQINNSILTVEDCLGVDTVVVMSVDVYVLVDPGCLNLHMCTVDNTYHTWKLRYPMEFLLITTKLRRMHGEMDELCNYPLRRQTLDRVMDCTGNGRLANTMVISIAKLKFPCRKIA